MRGTTFIVLAAAAGSFLTSVVASGQIQVGINVGLAPQCPYGYYDAAPYNCAPAGYYGPEWFSGETFIGAGPWFHGPDNFRGHVNNSFHPDHGYQGAMPNRGESAEPAKRVDAAHFKGNEERDGRGHATDAKR
jgi:hypothetical protein